MCYKKKNNFKLTSINTQCIYFINELKIIYLLLMYTQNIIGHLINNIHLTYDKKKKKRLTIYGFSIIIKLISKKLITFFF